MSVLTIDTGMSNQTKIAAVNDSYQLEDVHIVPIQPQDLQQKIIEEVQRSGLEQLAISSTWFISEDGKQGFIEQDGRKVVYIDLPVIVRETGVKNVAIYNDAEATALTLNVPHKEIILKEGHPDLPDTKTLAYLGTGFQLVRSHYHYDTEIFLPECGGGLNAAIPISVLDILTPDVLHNVAKSAGLTKISQLRHTHLLSARGLSNIHHALGGLQLSAEELIRSRPTRTFEIYSEILGRCLQNFASTAGFNQAIYLGGTFATAIAPYLDQQTLRKSFEVPHHLTRKAYTEIPIIVLDEPLAGNVGAAYGLIQGIESTAGIPY